MAEPQPVQILFVCLGNICRSPTAEAVMRDLVSEAGLDQRIKIESAGTGSWHIGHPPDERATATAAARGITVAGQAQQVTASDLERFDYVVAMDRENLADLRAMASSPGQEKKLSLLREHDGFAVAAGGELDVPDPYYGGERGFDLVLDVVEAGCRGLLAKVARDAGHMIGRADGHA